LIDETETTALEGADLDPVFDWHTRAKWPGLRQLKQVASRAGKSIADEVVCHKKTPFTWRLNHLFFHMSLCNSGTRPWRWRI